jgi:hypothetical protein
VTERENPIWSRLEPEGADADDQTGPDELPDHERDELRRRTDDQPGEPGTAEAGLPEHEQDERRGHDTGSQPYNP